MNRPNNIMVLILAALAFSCKPSEADKNLISYQQVHRLYDLKTDPYETKNLIDEVNLKSVVSKFQTKVGALPNLDSNPKYAKTKGLPTDVALEFLDKAAERTKHRENNMMGLATEEQFLRLSTTEHNKK